MEGADRLLSWLRALKKRKGLVLLAVLLGLAYLFPTAALFVLAVLLSLLAFLMYPTMSVKTIELDVDDLASWAGKGPAAAEPGFPKHLAAPFYLDGNVTPDLKLSALCVMDLTYCKYDAATRTMTFSSSDKFGFIAGTDCHDEAMRAPFGKKFFLMLATFGFCYDLVWDANFESAEVFIRTNRFTLGGGTLPLFPAAWYRWWIADVKKDGSAFKRHTCFAGRLNPGKDKWDGVPQHSYDPTRLVDGKGKVNAAVLAKLKSVWKGNLMTRSA